MPEPTATEIKTEPIKTETPVPFHEDPKILEFIQTQVKAGVEEGLKTFQPQPTVQSQTLSADDELVKEYISDLNLDENQSKKLISKIRKTVAPLIEQPSDSARKVEWIVKVNDLVSEFPDASSLNIEMDKIFQSKSKEDKEFILKSKDGLRYLYFEARNKKPSHTISTTGGSFGGNSVPSGVKTGASSIFSDQAIKAGLSGDKAGYEANVRKIAENGGFKK